MIFVNPRWCHHLGGEEEKICKVMYIKGCSMGNCTLNSLIDNDNNIIVDFT